MEQKSPEKKEEPAKSAVAAREEATLKFWQEKAIFEKSLAKESPAGNYVFYDGPPFATGLPHYGHILASAIKDAIPRYQTMRGHHVERRWGWDCHGLPIENIVEKDLKISGRKQIEEYGVEKFNEYARGKVLTYVHDWKKTVDRIGRWVDFDGSYKTMDNTFIESVWWALKEIHGKGLMYEGTRVLPYCPRCETPIANSEIAMDNSYKDISDISVYAEFELADEPKTFLLAWTTTPWTLPGNFALAISSEIQYVAVAGKESGKTYILAESRVAAVFGADHKIIRNVNPSEIIGKSYKPLFPYFAEKNFKNKERAWKAYAADFVTADAGTGIVHVSPGYGEDDMELSKKESIPFIHHVGTDGKFTADVKDFAGILVKPKPTKEEPKLHQSADVLIIKYLAAHGLLFKKESITHSYPHCFRCETPLYYYAIPAWFIRISQVKERLLALNENMNWIPGHLKEGRFKKSMEGAPDWNISRNRYWASPLPIWKCAECHEIEVVGTLAELRKKTSRGTEFFLMRHGEGEHNVANVLSSGLKSPHHLTESGKARAAKSALALKDKEIDLIIASPLLRTRETAEIAAAELGIPAGKIVFDERLREVDFGDWNGKDFSIYSGKDFFKTTAEKFEKPVPGGESLSDVRRRVGEFLYEASEKYGGKKILVVAHQSPLWLMLANIDGLDQKETIALRNDNLDFIPTASVVEAAFAPIPHSALYELDFHRPYIDAISWECSCKKGRMQRIPEVIDCWFESGSMPFGEQHYLGEALPDFDPKKRKNFPAQFVAEYIAQTRTWFYYSHAVSTILFDSIPFENIVTTGTILAEDGQKMSKSKGNFPDPWIIFDKYGVDALRYYLLSSQLLKSEDLNFSEKDVDGIYKKLILRLGNVVSFYELYADKNLAPSDASADALDRWMLSRLSELQIEVTENMEKYELDKALRPFDLFVDDLSTWYVRRSRDRFKSENIADKNAALMTTRFILLELAKLLAPFTPFIAEEIYLKTKTAEGKESVHLELWPKASKCDESLVEDMRAVRSAVTLGLEARMKANIKVRQPLAKLILKSEALKGKKEYLALIEDEVNVKEITFDSNLATDAELDTALTPALKEEGEMRELIRAIQDARKEAKLEAKDKMRLVAKVSEAQANLLRKFDAEIRAVCNLSAIEISLRSGEAQSFSFS